MGLGSHYESSPRFYFQPKTIENNVNYKIIIKI